MLQIRICSIVYIKILISAASIWHFFLKKQKNWVGNTIATEAGRIKMTSEGTCISFMYNHTVWLTSNLTGRKTKSPDRGQKNKQNKKEFPVWPWMERQSNVQKGSVIVEEIWDTQRESKMADRYRWRDREKGCQPLPGSSDDLFSFVVSSRDFGLAFFLDFHRSCSLHTELSDTDRLTHTLKHSHTSRNPNRWKPKIKSRHREWAHAKNLHKQTKLQNKKTRQNKQEMQKK